ncbi:hypothetical protein, partial [Salmonella sp. s51228]|uniref:hypothetical protein n=1 Tax=Salmonella sp. s51228 TaxID=3159652 RepID=UPI003980D3A7
MTDSYRQAILNAHNYQRTNVSPSPSDMNKLEWSRVLETMATYTAVACEEKREGGGGEEGGCGGFGAVG